jgi:hypothetical protein
MQLNEAQTIYALLGVDHFKLFMHSKGKQFSHRKTGPGRKHQQGKPNE